ncbi:MAG TPA: ThuA domain-containing protein [Solirubrobacter sp.]|nr:ThuA domain-containing protein [Solirubrobacter sp.]
MRTLRSALLALVVVLIAAPASALADTVVIDSVDAPQPAFVPANVTIHVGDAVRFEFDGATTTHTVTSTSANWSINETKDPGSAPITRTFDSAGTFTFLCSVHTGMTGSVTVTDGPVNTLEKVLVFSKTAGFRHDSIPQGIAAIQELGAQNGFAVTTTEDAAQFTDANLATYDVVVFLSTTGDVLDDAQQTAFEHYIQAGGGYVGIHAATDTEYTWPWYGQMLGAYFRNHPAGTPTATVKVEDPNEPSTTGLPASWTRTDEWYNFQPPTNPVVNGGGNDYSPRDSGVKVLLTVDESTYGEDDGNSTDDDHPVSWCSNFDGGRVWYTAMGHTQSSFSEPEFRAHLLGGIKTAAGVVNADCGPARQAPPAASDFELRTLDDDTESPMELAVAKDGRVFYVERITGEVNVIKPDGTVLTAGVIPVSSVQENGLLGIALDPDFATNHNLFVTYTPLPNSSTETRISRFTVVGDRLDMASERVIFQMQNQRTECCHSSGSLAFDKDGNLYLSTGDNTNPFASDGFNPIDERPGHEFWDAQRTSANTNSYSGKILRITPLANPTGAGVGAGYTIPPGNLFAPGTEKTRPEIFAMGFRNPFRITVDPYSGKILMGDYGPDASATNPNRGPQGSVEYNIVEPGFYGWPYCIRDNVAYNDYDFATGAIGPKFNCNAPVNDSPNNTGLTNLPPAKPATMWMGYSETDPRFPALGGGGAPTGGPRYRYDPDLQSDTKFPPFYDKQWFIGEWNNGWIKTATLNADTTAATNVAATPWMTTFHRPHEMEFGPDGSLYVIDWGTGFNGNNLDSGIYKIDYVKGARRPIAHASADKTDGPTPLAVQFSSAGSVDPEGTSLTYAWDFDGDGTTDSTEPNPSHTYTTAGNFRVLLTVTDQDGMTGTDSLLVVAGNTRPTVKLELPHDGQFADFGDKVPYRITVTDPEDGTIDCQNVTLSIQLGHDEHAHGLGAKQGCEGTFETLSDSGHDASMNIFTSIVATYTDKGGGSAQALTGLDDAVLHTRRKRAEHFTGTGRVPGSTATGDPGVQKEATADAGGGNNVGFIENGDYVYFDRMNFQDIGSIDFRVASAGVGGKIELRLDEPTAPTFASVDVTPTGAWQTWKTVSTTLANPPSGTHRLYVVFTNATSGDGLMNLNWFQVHGKGAAISAPPEVSATATPETGQAPLTVKFDATATDPEGEALTYAWDFGVAGTTTDTSTDEDPTYTYTNPGTYTAKVTVTDAAGIKASATVGVRVTGAPSQCPHNARSDEFDGSALDLQRWTVRRSFDNFQVRNGRLEVPIDNGSLYQAGTSAGNIITQPVPSGEWTVTAKVQAEALDENYQQAGLRVYSDDDNWASVHMISAGGNRQFEFIYEAAGNPRNGAADNSGALPADAPLSYYVRIHSDGTNLTAAYSFDGDTFTPVGQPAPLSTFVNPQIGPVALSDTAPSKPMAYFDWIRFDPDEGAATSAILDEFNGTDVATPPWEVVRRDQALTVSGGALHVPAQQGDVYGDVNTAKNLVLRAAPNGAWTATTKVGFEGNATYHQAGLIAYADDDNFVKLGRLAVDETGGEKFEFILETAGTPRNDAADSTANVPADFPRDYYLRIASDGTTITGAYSTDGSTWTPVGRPAPLPAGARIGMFAFSNAAATAPVADFDWFRLEGPAAPSGPSYDDEFDGGSLDKTRWNAIVRDNPAAYQVAGGNLTITTELGDIYTGDTDPPPNNFILQSADHAGADWTIETKLSGTLSDGYAQGGLIAYVDGDNYVKLDAISDVGNQAVNRIELRSEVGGAIQDPQNNVDVPAGTKDIWLRLTKTGTSYAGQLSFDGTTWTDMAAVPNAMSAPAFGLFAFGPQAAGVGDAVSFDYFWLDGQDPPRCDQCSGPGDEFDGASLDASKWNAIVRPDDTKVKVQDGKLQVTTVLGDIYTDSDPAGTRNFLLQTADHVGSEDYVLETKVDVTQLNGGYAQGGILVRTDDDNYVKLDAISDVDNPKFNRIELRSEQNGAIQEPQPQVTSGLPATVTDVWLRLTKTGTSYAGEYSFDGSTWTALSAPVTNTQTNAAFGLFTLGVQIADRVVGFEYFKVNGSTGCPPDETNHAPAISAVGATPATGFAPLPVQFSVTASDADDDELTYSWDFGDDGTSSAAAPSHTYTAAGSYTARVTVSDGKDEVSRTVPVSVLGADDPNARFRVLVFSKTTGFRHDSIPAGIAAIKQLGTQHQFQVDASEDAALFRDDALAHYDAVIWLSTTGDPLNDTQQAAFERYIRGGGGYVGVHAAADTEYTWTWYGKLVGAYFRNHPAGTPTATVRIDDAQHHSTVGLPNPWERVDEWYNYQRPDENAVVGGGGDDYSPRTGGVHVLATVDESTYGEDDGNATDDDHPISWCQRYDGGRSWYTGMGHTQASFAEAPFLTHLLGGIEVAAGAAEDAACGIVESGNHAPTVTASRNPSGDVTPGDPVAFMAVAEDADGDPLTYKWDFGDGGTATTKDALHAYTEVGMYTAKVTVSDGHGASGSASLTVLVMPAGSGSVDIGVGGVVPGVLGLDIAGSANFGAFAPGVTRDYTASLAATVTSSATAAELTVRDPSAAATGHLVNGTASLASPLQVRATDEAHPDTTFAPLPSSPTARLSLLPFPAPVSTHAVTIGFKQSIAATESLLVGGYGKTVVFTLSATTP